MFDLTGMVVAATGVGASPIGRATALLLAEHGATVVAGDLDLAAARKTASLIVSGGGRAIGRACDVRDPAQIDDLLASAASSFGGVDIVFGNAGILRVARLADLSIDDFRAQIDVNLTANFVLAKAAAPLLRSRGGGTIVFTASVAAFKGIRGGAAYDASKAGLVNLARALADELAEDGIRVNCVCPGYVETPMNTTELTDPNVRQRLLDRIPQRRLATPAEIAPAVLYLASPLSSFVTGEALVVDGGMLAT